MHVEAVDLDKIDAGPNVRTEIDRTEVEALAATIRDVGLIQPITLIRQQSGRFLLHIGFRRWTAYSLLAKEDPAYSRIPAVILDAEPPPDDQGLRQLIENVARVDLSPLDIAGGVAKYVEGADDAPTTKEERAARIAKLAATFRWSTRTVKKHLAFWHSPAWFRELGRAVKAERRKLDDAGNVVIDAKTNKPVMETKRWPPLQTSFLEKLLALLNDAEEADKEALDKDGSTKPRARSVVERVAVACAEQQWSVQRLDKEIEVARAGLRGAAEPRPQREAQTAYTATESRLVLDLRTKDAITAADRQVIAAHATKLLRELGFSSVVIAP
jgi:ParB/RepB/Spo0J family partition protein